jgi:hypothetical protein
LKAKTEENNAEKQIHCNRNYQPQAPKCGDKEVMKVCRHLIQKKKVLNTCYFHLYTPYKKNRLNNILTRSQNNDRKKRECEVDFIANPNNRNNEQVTTFCLQAF